VATTDVVVAVEKIAIESAAVDPAVAAIDAVEQTTEPVVPRLVASLAERLRAEMPAPYARPTPPKRRRPKRPRLHVGDVAAPVEQQPEPAPQPAARAPVTPGGDRPCAAPISTDHRHCGHKRKFFDHAGAEMERMRLIAVGVVADVRVYRCRYSEDCKAHWHVGVLREGMKGVAARRREEQRAQQSAPASQPEPVPAPIVAVVKPPAPVHVEQPIAAPPNNNAPPPQRLSRAQRRHFHGR
jgi:hypothetical protein